MRVAGAAYASATLEEAMALAADTARVTHLEGTPVAGAQAVCRGVWLARNGARPPEILADLRQAFDCFDFDRPLSDWRAKMPNLRWTKCEFSVPVAVRALVETPEAEGFEGVIRRAVSAGGDCDTVACMAGALAEPVFGVPPSLRKAVLRGLDNDLRAVVQDFERRFG